MFDRLKKRVSGALAVFFAVGLLMPNLSVNALTEEQKDLSKVLDFVPATSTSLGTAGGFGVFSNHFTNSTHMEGTIATANLTLHGNAFGVTDKVMHNAQSTSYYYYFETITGQPEHFLNFEKGGTSDSTYASVRENPYAMVFPSDVTFDYSANNGNGITIRDGQGYELGTFNSVTDVSLPERIMTIGQLNPSQVINFGSAFAALSGYANNYMNYSDATPIVLAENTITEINVDSTGNRVYMIDYSELQKTNAMLNIVYGEEDSIIINVVNIPGEASFQNGGNAITFNGGRQDDARNGDGSMSVLWNFGSFGQTALSLPPMLMY